MAKFDKMLLVPWETKKSAAYTNSIRRNALAQPMITIVYGSILRPSSNNWASYRRLKWQIPALFL
jgi:hypothetical protein